MVFNTGSTLGEGIVHVECVVYGVFSFCYVSGDPDFEAWSLYARGLSLLSIISSPAGVTGGIVVGTDGDPLWRSSGLPAVISTNEVIAQAGE